MSGAKRNGQYRKNITQEYLNSCPEPQEDELIVKVKGSRGSNIFEVEIPGGASELSVLPNKFKNVIWVKVNDFLIVERADIEIHSSSGGGARLQVKCILSKDHVKYIKSVGKWPDYFESPMEKRIDQTSYDGMPVLEDLEEYDEEYDQVIEKQSDEANDLLALKGSTPGVNETVF